MEKIDLFSGEWDLYSDPVVSIDFLHVGDGKFMLKKGSLELMEAIEENPQSVWSFVEGKYLSYLENDLTPALADKEKIIGYCIAEESHKSQIFSVLIWSIRMNCTYCLGTGRLRDSEDQRKVKCIYCEGKKTKEKLFPDYSDAEKFVAEHYKRLFGKPWPGQEDEGVSERQIEEGDSEYFEDALGYFELDSDSLDHIDEEKDDF